MRSSVAIRFAAFLLAVFALLHSTGIAETAQMDEHTAEIKEKYGKTTVDYFIENLDTETEERMVRSVLSESDEIILAKTLWGEDRENPIYMRAAIIWCIYNRMEASRLSIETLISPMQFAGYLPGNPVKSWAVKLVRDVTVRYVLEQNGFEDVGRVLPKRFLYYAQADGKRIHIFKTTLTQEERGYEKWDWSLPSPYRDQDFN